VSAGSTKIYPSGASLIKRYEDALSRAVLLMRRENPRLVGIQVHGSVARGEPGPFSDIDLLGIYETGKKPVQFSYFDGDIYVGMGFLPVSRLKKEFKDTESFYWARGSAENTRILYDPKGTLRKLVRQWKRAKLSNKLVESSLWDEYHNIVEYSGKLRNGWLKHDDYLTRYAASVIAKHAEAAIIILNDISIISENYLWHQVLGAKHKPKHLAVDYPLARGLRTGNMSKIYSSCLRLSGETLRLLRDQYGKRARHRKFRQLLAEPLDKHGL